ncbi:hypothetical protein L7F22_030525 [Adiantum nelumboides]|nr:hypothetical protein [Adiantum nelumboides]
MKKGIHPALQIMNIVSLDGHLWEVLTPPHIHKKEMADRYRSLTQEEEAAEREGQVARFYCRYSRQTEEGGSVLCKEASNKRSAGKEEKGKDED